MPPVLEFSGAVLDIGDDGPLEGAQVRGCPSLDPRCEAPVFVRRTDTEGRYAYRHEGPLSGYLEYSREGYVTLCEFTTSWALATRDPPRLLRLIDSPALELLVSLVDVERRGFVNVVAYGCDGEPARSVFLELQGGGPEVVGGYFRSELPSESAQSTDGSDQGYFGNMEESVVTVVARWGEGIIAETSALVRPATISQVLLYLPLPEL